MLIIGPAKTYRFFFQWRKAKGTACFLGGICLVLYGWAMVGIIVEGWGFINLFGDFFPTALCIAHRAAQQSTRTPRHIHIRIMAASLSHSSDRSGPCVRAAAFCATCRSSATCSRCPRCDTSRIGSSRKAGCPCDVT